MPGLWRLVGWADTVRSKLLIDCPTHHVPMAAVSVGQIGGNFRCEEVRKNGFNGFLSEKQNPRKPLPVLDFPILA